jgi:hypothetical protein
MVRNTASERAFGQCKAAAIFRMDIDRDNLRASPLALEGEVTVLRAHLKHSESSHLRG